MPTEKQRIARENAAQDALRARERDATALPIVPSVPVKNSPIRSKGAVFARLSDGTKLSAGIYKGIRKSRAKGSKAKAKARIQYGKGNGFGRSEANFSGELGRIIAYVSDVSTFPNRDTRKFLERNSIEWKIVDIARSAVELTAPAYSINFLIKSHKIKWLTGWEYALNANVPTIFDSPKRSKISAAAQSKLGAAIGAGYSLTFVPERRHKDVTRRSIIESRKKLRALQKRYNLPYEYLATFPEWALRDVTLQSALNTLSELVRIHDEILSEKSGIPVPLVDYSKDSNGNIIPLIGPDCDRNRVDAAIETQRNKERLRCKESGETYIPLDILTEYAPYLPSNTKLRSILKLIDKQQKIIDDMNKRGEKL